MMFSKKVHLLSFILVAGATANRTWPKQGCEFTGHQMVAPGIYLRHAADSKHERLTVELTYEGAAWLAFAFDEEGLVGSSAVIGLPDDPNPPQKFDIVKYDISGIKPRNSHDEIERASIVQNNTHTVLTFSQAFNEGGQSKLQVETVSNFSWAVGWDNTFAIPALEGHSQTRLGDCRNASGTTGVFLKSNSTTSISASKYHTSTHRMARLLSYNYPPPPTPAAAVPTNFPTRATTSEPTTQPTLRPTLHPTLTPTKAPTERPTKAPTERPTNSPMEALTDTPTEIPSPRQGSNAGIPRRAELDLNDGTVHIALETDPVNRLFTAEMTYEGQAWLGFAASSDGIMVGSTAIIALPDEVYGATNPGKYYLGGTDVVDVQLLAEDRQTLSSTFLSQNDTHTVMRFTKPFEEEGEEGVIKNDGLNTFIYAVGSRNSLGFHRIYDQFQIDWTQKAKNTDKPSPSPRTATLAPNKVTSDGGILLTELSFESGTVQIAMETKLGSKIITVDMTVEGARWIGWAPSDTGFMVGSTAIIALPDEPLSPTNPGKYYLGGKSVDAVQLLEDKRQTLTNTLIEQNETHTRMKFSKLLEEDGETPILIDQVNDFIYAAGFDNSLGVHRSRQSFSVDFLSGGVGTIEDYQSLWAVHGLLMSISWGILVPMAIGFSMLRDLLPLPSGMWFVLHRSLNLTAFACTFAAFWIAFSNIAKAAHDAAENPDHFTRITHRKVGLAIMVIVIVHLAWALLRPHVEKKVACSEDDGNNLDSLDDISNEVPLETANNNGPVEEKSFARRSWEAAHRLFGVTLLGMSWYNCYSGIKLFALRFGEQYNWTGAFWGVATGLAGLTIVLSMYRAVRKKLTVE